MKVALVYDRVNKIGGAEKVLLALHQLFPQAPLYTAVYNPHTAKWAKIFTIHPSFINHIPGASTHHEWFAWAAPYAFESFNFDYYDVVISVTSAEAKGIITKPHTLHFCYLLTPTRYLWSHTHFYRQVTHSPNHNFLTRKITPLFFSRLRRWDQIAAWRPDRLIAISKTVSARSHKYYRRPADAIIYPPVQDFSCIKPDLTTALPDEYYLLVSRLVPYKRIDLAIQAFRHLPHQLVIIGEGSQKNALQKLASPNVKILGGLSEAKLAAFYQNTRALIFPSEEDFGIVSVEAQFCGKPVISYAQGGGAETVIPGKTGTIFRHHTPTSLIRAIKRSQTMRFFPQTCKKNAHNFSTSIFQHQLQNYIQSSWQQHQNSFL